jgi:hypothetical protein
VAELRYEPLFLEPFHTVAPDNLLIADYLDLIPGLPADFAAAGGVFVDGLEIPRSQWRYVRPRGKREILLAMPPMGDNDGKTGGVLSIVASVALLVATAGVAAGALAPILGASFAAGSVGAQLAAAGVGLVGQLALSALFPPPTPQSAFDEAKEEGRASIGGDLVEPGGAVPRAIGQRRLRPKLAFRPISEMVEGDEVAEAVYVLAGPHKLVKAFNGEADILEADGVDTEVREGFDGDIPLSQFRRYGRPEDVNITLSKHKLEEADSTTLANQNAPESALPRYHRVTTGKDPDEIWLRLTMIGIADSNNSANQYMMFRPRIRRVGDTTWQNLPELVYLGRSEQPVRREIKIILDRARPTIWVDKNVDTFRWAFDEVEGVNVDHVISKTPASNPQYEADLTFDVVRGTDGIELYPASSETWFDGGGTYELEIKRSLMFDQGDATINGSTYDWSNGNTYDFFDAYHDGSNWVVRETPKGTAEQVILSRVTSIWNSPPVVGTGWFLFGVRARNQQVNTLTLEVCGYVPDWDGVAWQNWTATANPAANFRYFQSGPIAVDPVADNQADNDSLVNWRAHCATQGYECNAVIDGDQSVGAVLDLIAGCGYARRRQGHTFGVVYDRDRSAETAVQHINATKMANFASARAFTRKPRGLRCGYQDASNQFRRAEVTVQDPVGVTTDHGEIEKVDYPGLTSEAEVIARARYDMATGRFRETLHTFTIGVDSLTVEKGDLIEVAHPTLKRHHEYCFVAEVIAGDQLRLDAPLTFIDEDGLFAQSETFSLDDFYLPGNQSAAAIRNSVGGVQAQDITAYNADTRIITLAAAVTAGEGDEVTIGLSGSIADRMFVHSIDFGPDLTAKVVCVDEAPAMLDFLP